MSFEDIARETGWSYRQVRRYYYSAVSKLTIAFRSEGVDPYDIFDDGCKMRSAFQIVGEIFEDDDAEEDERLGSREGQTPPCAIACSASVR